MTGHIVSAVGKEGDEFWCLAWFLLFIQSKTPALGAPILRVGLPASITQSRTFLQARPEFVFQLIPGPIIKLTVVVNAYTWKLIACLEAWPDADSMFAKASALP